MNPIYKPLHYFRGAMTLKWIPIAKGTRAKTIRERGYEVRVLTAEQAARLNGKVA